MKRAIANQGLIKNKRYFKIGRFRLSADNSEIRKRLHQTANVRFASAFPQKK